MLGIHEGWQGAGTHGHRAGLQGRYPPEQRGLVWQQDGDDWFSLLPGTNRLKTDAEIAAAAVKAFDAIKPS